MTTGSAVIGYADEFFVELLVRWAWQNVNFRLQSVDARRYAGERNISADVAT